MISIDSFLRIFNILPQNNAPPPPPPMKKPFENTVGKMRKCYNAGNQHFLLFLQYFSTPFKSEIMITGNISLSSAKALNSVKAKNLSFDKELKSPKSRSKRINKSLLIPLNSSCLRYFPTSLRTGPKC